MGSGYSRSHRLPSDGNTAKQRKKKPQHPLENSEEQEDHRSSDRSLSSSSWGEAGDNPHVTSEHRERIGSGQERPRRPPLPRISGEVFLTTEADDWEAYNGHRTRNLGKRSRHQERLSPVSSPNAGLHCKEPVCGREPGQGEHRGRRHGPRSPPFSESEERPHHHDPGNKGPS